MGANKSPGDISYVRSTLIVSFILSVIASGVFLAWPQIDLILAGLLFNPETGFFLNRFQTVKITRQAIIIGYAIWYSGLVALMIFAIYEFRKDKSLRKQYGFLKLDLTQLIYLVATSIAGPLLIANAIFKNNWGRARPRQITEFGGSQEFGPPLLMSDQCETNCSFVSGEPSSMFMIFMALSFALPLHRKKLMVTAIILGAVSGVMRMGQGGHFFSDVVFAGLFMAITAAALYWIMFILPANRKA